MSKKQAPEVGVELLCKALGMDLHAKNALEVPNIDFLQV
jgi:hypothetical protein